MRTFLEIGVGLFITAVSTSVSQYQTPLHCPNNHIYYDPQFGLIKEIKVADEFECISECEQTDECVGYNIEQPDLMCEFNDDQTNTYGDDMIPRDGWTYWEKLDKKINETCSLNYLDGRKQREVTARVNDTLIASRGYAYGWWGKDTGLSDTKVYYLPSWHADSIVYAYYTEDDFVANNNYIKHIISPTATGNSWIVHKRKFWYREHHEARLIIWNFDTGALEKSISFEVMGQATGYTKTAECQYDSNIDGLVDLEVDEMGRMFMIWGDINMECALRISVIDTNEYKIVRTIGIDGMIRKSGGNGFIVDDIYYMTENYNNRPTWIMVEWNFRNTSTYFRQTGADGISNALPWPQPAGANGNLHWNPIDQKLYSTHYGRHYRSDLTFQDLP